MLRPRCCEGPREVNFVICPSLQTSTQACGHHPKFVTAWDVCTTNAQPVHVLEKQTGRLFRCTVFMHCVLPRPYSHICKAGTFLFFFNLSCCTAKYNTPRGSSSCGQDVVSGHSARSTHVQCLHASLQSSVSVSVLESRKS